MTDYTLEQLMAMNDEALTKAAKAAFSMQFVPFSTLGKRTMKRHLDEAGWRAKSSRISPALKTIIGEPAHIIEQILDYQDALSNRDAAKIA